MTGDQIVALASLFGIVIGVSIQSFWPGLSMHELMRRLLSVKK